MANGVFSFGEYAPDFENFHHGAEDNFGEVLSCEKRLKPELKYAS